MARTNLHQLVLELGGPVATWASSFSGGATLMAPASGNKLQIFSMEAASDAATDVRFFIGSQQIWTAYMGANSHRKIDLTGRYVEVADGSHLEVTRPGGENSEANIVVHYREVSATGGLS